MKKIYYHISLIIFLLLGGALHTSAADYGDMDSLLQSLQSQQQDNPLSGLYRSMRQDALDFAYGMASRDTQERFGSTVPEYGAVLDADGNPVLRTWAAGFLSAEAVKSYYGSSLRRYLDFLDVYLVAKYGAMFSNGSRQDSGFDIYSDINDIRLSLVEPDTAKKGSEVSYGGFDRGLTPYARKKTGSGQLNFLATQEDKDIASQAIANGEYQFGTPETYFGVCSLPVSSLGSDGQLSTVASFMSKSDEGSGETMSMDQILPVTDDSLLQKLFNGDTIRERSCIPDPNTGRPSDFCVSLDVIQRQPSLTRNAKVLSLEDATNLLYAVTNEMSSKDLRARQDSDVSFSLPWFNLKLEPFFRLEVKFIPLFASRQFGDMFTLEGINAIHNDWNALKRGGNFVNADQGQVAGGQSIFFSTSKDVLSGANIEAGLAIYKDTQVLRTRFETEKKFVDFYSSAMQGILEMTSRLNSETKEVQDITAQMVKQLLE